MTIQETGRLVFQVSSTTPGGDPRTVDMGKYRGSGQCDCWTFLNQIRKAVEAYLAEHRSKPFDYVPIERHQCVHIQAVNRHLANRLVQEVRKAYPDDKDVT
jgi:hypothetical protein